MVTSVQVSDTAAPSPDGSTALCSVTRTGSRPAFFPLPTLAAVPCGGTIRSGVGRELGRSGRDRFASIKSYGILSPPSPDARPPRESQPMPILSRQAKITRLRG